MDALRKKASGKQVTTLENPRLIQCWEVSRISKICRELNYWKDSNLLHWHRIIGLGQHTSLLNIRISSRQSLNLLANLSHPGSFHSHRRFSRRDVSDQSSCIHCGDCSHASVSFQADGRLGDYERADCQPQLLHKICGCYSVL